MKLLINHSYKWRNIGLALGFTHPELNLIEHNPILMFNAPSSYLVALLGQFVEWPNEDHENYPTLKKLCEALRSSIVGLGALAIKVASTDLKSSKSW